MGFFHPGRSIRNRTAGRRRASLYTLPPRPSHPPSPRPSHPPSTPPSPPKRKSTLPTLPTLPTELLHKIFLHALNPHLPETCRTLWTVLQPTRHLRNSWVSSYLLSSPARLLRSRFLTSSVVYEFEASHGTMALEGVPLPLRLLDFTDDPGEGALMRLLVERGARWEHPSEALRAAVETGVWSLVEQVLLEPCVRADAGCLEMAVRGSAGTEVVEHLVGRGAEVGLGVWRAAVERGEAGDGGVLEWLLEREVSPGELLGFLLGRQRGETGPWLEWGKDGQYRL